MGIVPDSTFLIAAERAGSTPRKVIAGIIARHGDVETALSVITVTELAHGIERAHSYERALARERFLNELVREMTADWRDGSGSGLCRAHQQCSTF